MTLFQFLKDRLVNRGAGSIIGLRRIFQIIDKDSVGKISFDNFSLIMKDLRIDLSKEQNTLLFTLFDKDENGLINYNEFIRALQGQLSIKRFELVSKWFEFLDKDKKGEISIGELIENFDASKHPDVISGKHTVKEVTEKFASEFKEHHLVETEASGVTNVTKNEFVDYYTTVSATVTMDSDFELILNNCWNLEAETLASHYERGWTDKKNASRTMEEEILYRKLVPETIPTLSSGLESRQNPWQTVNTYYQYKK